MINYIFIARRKDEGNARRLLIIIHLLGPLKKLILEQQVCRLN